MKARGMQFSSSSLDARELKALQGVPDRIIVLEEEGEREKMFYVPEKSWSSSSTASSELKEEGGYLVEWDSLLLYPQAIEQILVTQVCKVLGAWYFSSYSH